MDDFDYYQSGALLALNTFGPHLLACISLPLLCLSSRQLTCLLGQSLAFQAGLTAVRHEFIEGDIGADTVSGSTNSGVSDRAGRTGQGFVLCAPEDVPAGRYVSMNVIGEQSICEKKLRRVVLAFMTCHSLTAVAATISAALQRRHLMVWALFAPKFVFEATTLVVCDVALILLAAVSGFTFSQ